MGIEILAYETTPLGTLCLRRRELLSRPGTMVTEVTLNHEFLMSSYLTESERALTRIGLELVTKSTSNSIQNPSDSVCSLSVLVGGLGLGYTAAEALRSDKVSTVEVVEFLPEVIGWTKNGLIPLSDQLNSDPRLKITHGDVYAKVQGYSPSEKSELFEHNDREHRFDLIAIDVDHSPQDVLGDQSHGFYTVEGLKSVRQQLKPGGVLGVWSYAADSPFLDNMKTVFDNVQVEQVTAWNDLIDVEQTDWLFFGYNRVNNQ